MQRNKLFILGIIVCLFFLAVLFLVNRSTVSKLTISDKGDFNIEIVRSKKQQYAGLSGREEMCQSCGMLFVFSEAGKYEFSMRDMKFPLDFIWIEGGEIVDVKKNIQIDFAEKIVSEKKIDAVLELNAGSVDNEGIEIGDGVSY